MKRLFTLMVSLLSLLLTGGLGAQEKATSDYVLGPEDVIEITVPSHSRFPNEKDLNKTLVILPDGKIHYSEGGVLTAAGKTPNALAAEIKTFLEKTRSNVVVVVSVKEIHSQRARILGAIKNAGSYDLKPGWHLLDMVASAGGLIAKPTHIFGHIVRNTTELLPLDVPQALNAPNGKANVLLEPGDLILLNERDIPNQVHVMGQVGRPGAFELKEDMTVVSLVSEAGSPTERSALSKAYILRGETRIPMNLLPILLQGKTDETVTKFKLEAGDVLFIPELTLRIGVMGQVNHPGFFPIPETEEPTILKALSIAGGQVPDADLRKAGILRTVNGKVTVLPINIEEMLTRGKLATNVALQSEDVLYIPSRKHTFKWVDILNPITALYYLGRI